MKQIKMMLVVAVSLVGAPQLFGMDKQAREDMIFRREAREMARGTLGGFQRQPPLSNEEKLKIAQKRLGEAAEAVDAKEVEAVAATNPDIKKKYDSLESVIRARVRDAEAKKAWALGEIRAIEEYQQQEALRQLEAVAADVGLRAKEAEMAARRSPSPVSEAGSVEEDDAIIARLMGENEAMSIDQANEKLADIRAEHAKKREEERLQRVRESEKERLRQQEEMDEKLARSLQYGPEEVALSGAGELPGRTEWYIGGFDPGAIHVAKQVGEQHVVDYGMCFGTPDFLDLTNFFVHQVSLQQLQVACGYFSLANAEALRMGLQEGDITSSAIQWRTKRLFDSMISQEHFKMNVCPTTNLIRFAEADHVIFAGREAEIPIAIHSDEEFPKLMNIENLKRAETRNNEFYRVIVDKIKRNRLTCFLTAAPLHGHFLLIFVIRYPAGLYNNAEDIYHIGLLDSLNQLIQLPQKQQLVEYLRFVDRAVERAKAQPVRVGPAPL